jgi:Predicted exonuclease
MNRFDRFFEETRRTPEEERARRTPGEVRGLPEGEWVDQGVYRLSHTYAIGAPHGAHPLENPDDMAEMRHFGAKERVVFLDLETTGLAGGTGTYAFLCGIGFADRGVFRVLQFFLGGPAHEAAWLRAVGESIPDDACLATYNGKTFDIPLLRTRHVLARSAPAWDRLPHLDLLHYARRLYRGHLESCSLSSMERNVLAVARSGEDIPGAMIPPLYMQFLRTRDATPLRGVFYHNVLDIVSLAALYCHISHVLAGERGDGRELTRGGDIWQARGEYARAGRLWDIACEREVSGAEAFARKGFAAKKRGDHIAAADAFSSALSLLTQDPRKYRGDFLSYKTLEELAKLQEHRLRSPQAALGHTEAALEWLRANRYFLGRQYGVLHRAMRQRQARLERKAGKGGGNDDVEP